MTDSSFEAVPAGALTWLRGWRENISHTKRNDSWEMLVALAVVVGAQGFIGTTLAAYLEKDGAKVIRVGREDFREIHGRIPREWYPAKAVYWLASSINPMLAASRPDLVALDAEALQTYLDAAEADGFQAPFILLSSGGSVYGKAPAPQSEKTIPAPSTDYGDAKLHLERMVIWRCPNYLVLRVSNAYGPGQRANQGQAVIAHWLNAIQRNQDLVLFGDERSARDYIYINDVCAALARAVQFALPPVRIINIGSGVPTSLRRLVELVCETTGFSPTRVVNKDQRSFDAPTTWLDITSARENLQWEPTTTLSQGLTRTWRWVRSSSAKLL